MHYPEPGRPFTTDPALPERELRRLTRSVAILSIPGPRQLKCLAAASIAVTAICNYNSDSQVQICATLFGVPAVILLAGALARGVRAIGSHRAARRHPGAIVRDPDLSQPALDLLRRARTATWSVRSAAVFRDGHLGDQAVLLDTEWHIARSLRDMTALEDAHAIIAGHDTAADPGVDAVAAPQRAVLAQVLAGITGRVSQLEAYAARVAAANSAYRSWQTASALARLDGAMLNLLADTSGGGGTFDDQIAALAEQASTARDTFRASLDDARAFALAVPPVPGDVTAGA